MGKPKKINSGFNPHKPKATQRQQIAKNAADHAAQEQNLIALINQGKLQEVEVICRQLIAMGTKNYMVYSNLAAICGMQGRFNDSIAFLKKSLDLEPMNPVSFLNLGIAFKEKNNLNAAISACHRAIELKSDYSEAYLQLGDCLKANHQIDAAIEAYKKASNIDPKYTKAFYSLGVMLHNKGDLNAARRSFQTALDIRGNIPEILLSLGNTLIEIGDTPSAIISYRKGLRLSPKQPVAHNNLGNALQEQGDIDAAIACYNTAIQLKPNYSDAHNNLGIALQTLGDLDAAIASYNTAIQLKPNYPDAHNNLGISLQMLGDLDAAIASYNTAIQLQPNYPDAHLNSSLTMLLSGDYKNGWEKYEWRFKKQNSYTKPHALPKCNRWNGKSDLLKTNQLLLVTEQGLGDTLHFVRYVNALKKHGASISLCAQPKLHALIQASGIDSSPLTPEEANKVTEGKWIPLLSLPRHLNVSAENPIITQPYIKTTKELTTKWADILVDEQRPIIGINWQGNPKAEETVLLGRSLILEAFTPITDNKRISLLSLQKGFGSEQLNTCLFKDRFVSCQDQVNDTWDFLETAAIIANCDLVITSDTSVAHLAGGMGKTTWLLLHKIPDWRWGLESETSFWYPSMRLFRQRKQGNWDEVIERVAEALQEHWGG